MRFLRQYWFSLLMSVFLLCAIAYFAVVFVSPRYDMQHRGFVPCTKQLATNVEACGQGKVLCILGTIGTDNLCNLKVIAKGFKNWLAGEQNAPWSNYIFTPELPQNPSPDEEETEEVYTIDQDLLQDMEKLKKLNKEQHTDE